MKGTTLLHICVITPLWTPVKITTPLNPKQINLQLIYSTVMPHRPLRSLKSYWLGS